MRRLIRYIAGCLVLGTISTILAAWICAAWVGVWDSNLIREGVTAQQGHAWRVAIYQRAGAHYVRAQAIWDVALYQHGRFANADRVLDPASYAPFKLLRDPPDPAQPLDWRHMVSSRGWPVPAVRGNISFSGDKAPSTRQPFNRLAPIGMADLERIVTGDPIVDDDVTVALVRPIWRGFSVDTVFYSTAWAIVLSVLVPVWRMLGAKPIAWRGVTGAALGGLTTVAVAWGCALWIDVGTGRAWTEIYRARGAGDRVVFVQQSITAGAARLQQQDEPLGTSLRTIPWTRVPSPGSTPSGSLAVTIVDARGWPFTALRCQFDALIDKRTGRGRVERIKYGIPLESAASSSAGPLRAATLLPWGPVGVGFAADMVLYSAAWFALLILGAVPRWIRCVGRRRRGECEHCGYDLRGGRHSCCPECGAVSGTRWTGASGQGP